MASPVFAKPVLSDIWLGSFTSRFAHIVKPRDLSADLKLCRSKIRVTGKIETWQAAAIWGFRLGDCVAKQSRARADVRIPARDIAFWWSRLLMPEAMAETAGLCGLSPGTIEYMLQELAHFSACAGETTNEQCQTAAAAEHGEQSALLAMAGASAGTQAFEAAQEIPGPVVTPDTFAADAKAVGGQVENFGELFRYDARTPQQIADAGGFFPNPEKPMGSISDHVLSGQTGTGSYVSTSAVPSNAENAKNIASLIAQPDPANFDEKWWLDFSADTADYPEAPRSQKFYIYEYRIAGAEGVKIPDGTGVDVEKEVVVRSANLNNVGQYRVIEIEYPFQQNDGFWKKSINPSVTMRDWTPLPEPKLGSAGSAFRALKSGVAPALKSASRQLLATRIASMGVAKVLGRLALGAAGLVLAIVDSSPGACADLSSMGSDFEPGDCSKPLKGFGPKFLGFLALSFSGDAGSSGVDSQLKYLENNPDLCANIKFTFNQIRRNAYSRVTCESNGFSDSVTKAKIEMQGPLVARISLRESPANTNLQHKVTSFQFNEHGEPAFMCATDMTVAPDKPCGVRWPIKRVSNQGIEFDMPPNSDFSAASLQGLATNALFQAQQRQNEGQEVVACCQGNEWARQHTAACEGHGIRPGGVQTPIVPGEATEIGR